MKMVAELHGRGYTGLYFYAGLSPAGLHWRYKIGLIDESGWPNEPELACGSVGDTGQLAWTKDAKSASTMADDFIQHYALDSASKIMKY